MSVKQMVTPSLGTALKLIILGFLAGIISGVMFSGTLGSILFLLQIGFVITVLGMLALTTYRIVKSRRGSINESTN